MEKLFLLISFQLMLAFCSHAPNADDIIGKWKDSDNPDKRLKYIKATMKNIMVKVLPMAF